MSPIMGRLKDNIGGAHTDFIAVKPLFVFDLHLLVSFCSCSVLFCNCFDLFCGYYSCVIVLPFLVVILHLSVVILCVSVVGFAPFRSPCGSLSVSLQLSGCFCVSLW